MTKIALFALATMFVVGAGLSNASAAWTSTPSYPNQYSQVDGSKTPENALFTRAVGSIR